MQAEAGRAFWSSEVPRSRSRPGFPPQPPEKNLEMGIRSPGGVEFRGSEPCPALTPRKLEFRASSIPIPSRVPSTVAAEGRSEDPRIRDPRSAEAMQDPGRSRGGRSEDPRSRSRPGFRGSRPCGGSIRGSEIRDARGSPAGDPAGPNPRIRARGPGIRSRRGYGVPKFRSWSYPSPPARFSGISELGLWPSLEFRSNRSGRPWISHGSPGPSLEFPRIALEFLNSEFPRIRDGVTVPPL